MDAGLVWTIVGSAAAVVAIPAGVVIGVLQLRQGRRAAGPSGDEPRQALRPLPAQVPGTVVIGYIPRLPSRFIARAGIFDTVRDDVVAHAAVGLIGMGGAGKTVLATAVARDEAVQEAFSGGIAWVDAGQHATPVLLQERLAAQLTHDPVSFPSAEAGRNRLAELLAGRAFLLVIDDVWDAEVLSALDVVGAPLGALLFTTRDLGIARAVGATARGVDKLSLEQALALLGRWTDTDSDQLPPVADALCMRVGNLALGVALVGGMVKGRGAQPRDWQDVMGLLDPANVKAIADEYGPDHYKHPSVLASITLSIDDLPPADRDRYRELAVFAGRGGVPPAAVSVLWASAGCSAEDTGRLIARLTDRSLAQRGDRGWITLHDLEYDVAAHQLGPGGLALAHGRLLDGYHSQLPQAASVPSANGHDGASAWAEGPDDGYLFQNLAYHLAHAGCFQQLNELLVNFAWLERKLAVAGISDLLADYSHQQPRPPDVDTVHGALQLSAHVLASEPGQLASQLAGRLLSQPEPSIRALLDTARRSDGHPWLCPRTPGSLTEPGGPLERTLQGHTGSVEAVGVTPDGQRIISGSQDGTVRVWNLASGRPERTLKGHTGGVAAVAVTPDGQRIISGSSLDGTVRVWNLASGRPERTLEGHTGGVKAVAVTPDGQRIISGSLDGTVRVWNLASGRPERTLKGHTGGVKAVAVTPDGQRIISGSGDQTVRVWDLASGRTLQTLEGPTNYFLAAAVTADGQRIISGSDDLTTAVVWNVASGRPERTLKGHTGEPRAVAVTADGQRIISGSDDGTVRVWDLASGRPERTLKGHTDWVPAVAVMPDGQRIISGAHDQTVRVWDLVSGGLERTLEGHTGWVEAVAVTPDGQRIISGGGDQTVRVWDLASGGLERTLEGHTGGVKAVAVTPDGQRIVSGSLDGTVRVWDLVSGGLERTLEGHTGWVEAVAVTADGQRIISGSGDQTVRVWDLASGTELAHWVADTTVVCCAGHPRDPATLVYGDLDGRVVVLSLREPHPARATPTR